MVVCSCAAGGAGPGQCQAFVEANIDARLTEQHSYRAASFNKALLLQTLAVEVLWTPQDENDYYTRDEVFSDFPTLNNL